MTTELVDMHMPLARGFSTVPEEPALPLAPALPLLPELPLLPVVPPVLLAMPPLPKVPLVPEPELPLVPPIGPAPLAPPLPAANPIGRQSMLGSEQISASSAWLTSTPVAQAAAPPNPAPASAMHQIAARVVARSWFLRSEPSRCTIPTLIPQAEPRSSACPPGAASRREASDRGVQIGGNGTLIGWFRGRLGLALLTLCGLCACGASKRPRPAAGDGDPSSETGGAGSGGRGGAGGQGGGAGSAAMAGNAGGFGMSGSGGGSGGSESSEPSCIPREACRSYCGAFGVDTSAC